MLSFIWCCFVVACVLYYFVRRLKASDSANTGPTKSCFVSHVEGSWGTCNASAMALLIQDNSRFVVRCLKFMRVMMMDVMMHVFASSCLRQPFNDCWMPMMARVLQRRRLMGLEFTWWGTYHSHKDPSFVFLPAACACLLLEGMQQ